MTGLQTMDLSTKPDQRFVVALFNDDGTLSRISKSLPIHRAVRLADVAALHNGQAA